MELKDYEQILRERLNIATTELETLKSELQKIDFEYSVDAKNKMDKDLLKQWIHRHEEWISHLKKMLLSIEDKSIRFTEISDQITF
jgi:hypothetical protein